MHQLTKTDFIQYINCPESLWLLKNRPNEFTKGEFSLFLEKLIKEGYEVEEYAKLLFPSGLDLPENSTPQYTKQQLNSKNKVFFQPSFLSQKGVFARIDILEKLSELAKQSALICVDEVLENISEEVSTYNPFMMNTDYWQEVKQEINKLW